jgi:hypothetical protein
LPVFPGGLARQPAFRISGAGVIPILSGNVVIHGDVAASKVMGHHACHAAVTGNETRIAVGIDDVDVVDDGDVVDDSSAVAIPGPVNLIRCERHPSDVDAAPAEERHKSRTPRIAHRDDARIPDPSIAGRVIPAAVVIGSPAPRIPADPGPAVVVHPGPAADAVRSPSGGDRGNPDPAVGRIVDPVAMTGEILGAIDIPADIFIAVAAVQFAVSILVPQVPLVTGKGVTVSALRIGRITAHQQGLTLAKSIAIAPDIDLAFTGSDCDFCGEIVANGDAVNAIFGGNE